MVSATLAAAAAALAVVLQVNIVWPKGHIKHTSGSKMLRYPVQLIGRTG